MLNFINLMIAVSMLENRMSVQTIQANDSQGGALTYGISGGADAAKFSIDAVTGVLTFAEAPDHDYPGDADGNNVYEVEVTASSNSGAAPITQALTITVNQSNDALEKVHDLADAAGKLIAIETAHNEAQDLRIVGVETDVAGKAAQADVDQLTTTVGTKADQTAVDQLNTTVNSKAAQSALDTVASTATQNSTRVNALEQYFDGNEIIGIEHLPEQLRTGMKPLGAFAVGTDTLPAATDENEWRYYIADDYGQVDLSAAQDGSRVVDVAPKGWIMSTGADTGWRYMSGGDGLTTVNGKTAQNGAVIINAADTPYAPSEASGLSANTSKAGIDEVGIKVKEVASALGDVSTFKPVDVLIGSYNARYALGYTA